MLSWVKHEQSCIISAPDQQKNMASDRCLDCLPGGQYLTDEAIGSKLDFFKL